MQHDQLKPKKEKKKEIQLTRTINQKEYSLIKTCTVKNLNTVTKE